MKRFHYAWVILFITFFGLLSAQGVRLSFGAFVAPWEEDFQTSRGIISFIAFISFIVYGISQPYVGRLVDKYGVRLILSYSILLIGIMTVLTYFTSNPWQLMLLYGLIASIGFGGASNVAGSVLVANWFVEKKGVALGLMTAGGAAGQLLLVPLSLYLISLFGWKDTVLILGGFLTCIVFPLMLLFIRTSPADKGLTAFGYRKKEPLEQPLIDVPVKKLHISIFNLFRSRAFLILLFTFFVCGVTTTGLIDTHLIPFAQYCGFSPVMTGAAVSVLAGFNILGTITAGFLADRWNCKMILAFLYGARALTLVILLVIVNDITLFGFFISQSHLLFLFAISFGIVDFATVAPTIKLISDYFQQYSVGVIIGYIFLSHQLGSALGAYIPGLLFDISSSYTSSFVYAFILLVFSSILCFFLPKTDEEEIKGSDPSTTTSS